MPSTAPAARYLWTYDPQVWKIHPHAMNYNFAVNRGVAYADGRIFATALDGRLTALDAKTGKPLWTAQTVRGNERADRHRRAARV